MPPKNLAELRPALEQRFRAARKRQPNRSTVLLNVLAKTSATGRKNWAARITTGTAVGQVFSDGQDFTEFQADDDQPISLPWALYGDTFSFTNLAADGAAGDPGEFARLFIKESSDASDRTAAKINLDLWNGPGTTGPQRIHGLCAPGGILDATGVYAGQDRALVPQWGGNRFTNGGTPREFSIALVEQAIDATYVASGHTPTLCVTTPALWREYKRLAKAETIQRIVIDGKEIALDAGCLSLEIDGVPILKDKDCPAGTWVGLSTQCLGIERLRPSPARVQTLMAVDLPIAGTAEDQYGSPGPDSNPLGAELYKLDTTGNYAKYAIETKVAFWCDRPNANLWMDDLQVAA